MSSVAVRPASSRRASPSRLGAGTDRGPDLFRAVLRRVACARGSTRVIHAYAAVLNVNVNIAGLPAIHTRTAPPSPEGVLTIYCVHRDVPRTHARGAFPVRSDGMIISPCAATVCRLHQYSTRSYTFPTSHIFDRDCRYINQTKHATCMQRCVKLRSCMPCMAIVRKDRVVAVHLTM